MSINSNRCYQMIFDGLLDEFITFINQSQKKFFDYNDAPIPIGKKDYKNFLKD